MAEMRSRRCRAFFVRRSFAALAVSVLAIGIVGYGLDTQLAFGNPHRRLIMPLARRRRRSVLKAAVSEDTFDMARWSARELKRFLSERSIPHNDCFEKQDLLDRAVAAQGAPKVTVDAKAVAAQGAPKVTVDAKAAGPSANEFVGYGELVTVPSAQQEQASMIFFHGFGDSARGFVSQLPNLLQLPSMRYVLPTAKSQGGMKSWFGLGGGNAAEDSIDYAHHLIRKELARGTPGSKLFVGGFSQGGCVAVQAALSFPDAQLGGCVAASTFLGGTASQLRVADANRRLPVLVCHGEADSAVPLSSGQALAAALRERSVPTHFRSYPNMNHAYCAEESADVRNFVKLRMILAGGVEALKQMSARELKALLADAGASTAGCLEKADFLERARQVLL